MITKNIKLIFSLVVFVMLQISCQKEVGLKDAHSSYIKTYNQFNGFFTSVLKVSDDQYFFLGRNTDNASNDNDTIFAMMTDVYGNVLWEKKLKSESRLFYTQMNCMLLPDGSILVSQRQSTGRIIHFSPEGEILNTIQNLDFNAPEFSQFSEPIIGPDGKFYLCSSHKNLKQNYIIAFTLDGNVEIVTTFSDGSSEREIESLYRIEEDTAYLDATSFEFYPTVYRMLYAVNLNTGEILRTKVLTDTVSVKHEYPTAHPKNPVITNGMVYSLGLDIDRLSIDHNLYRSYMRNYTVHQTDFVMNKLWSKKLDGSPANINGLPQGGAVICGDNAQSSTPFITELDEAGNIVITSNDFPDRVEFNDIIKLDDGSYLIAGTTGDMGLGLNKYRPKAVVVKLTKEGKLENWK